MTAGQRKRRKREALMRRSAMSSRPLSAQRSRHDAKTSFSSRGNTLGWGREQDHCLPPLQGCPTPPDCTSKNDHPPPFPSTHPDMQGKGEAGIRNQPCTDQWELTTLQRASSQHMRRLAWWSAKVEAEHFMGSTSQFSSDSYKARMNSPGGEGRANRGWDQQLPPQAPTGSDPHKAASEVGRSPSPCSGELQAGRVKSSLALLQMPGPAVE